jgi:hypothetical protein
MDPYNYLLEVEHALRADPLSRVEGVALPSVSFSQLQSDPDRESLLDVLIAALEVPNGTTRKSAAKALAQVGDNCPRVIQALTSRIDAEPAKGNKDALAAALMVLRQIPLSAGSSEMQRLKGVENAYFNRPVTYDGPSPYERRPKPQSAGCLSMIFLAVALVALAAGVSS